MLKTLLFMFGSELSKIADGMNDEVVRGGNKNTVFLFKKSKNVKSKNLTNA